jgi:ABC-type arginine/histidine transport system permease subunit
MRTDPSFAALAEPDSPASVSHIRDGRWRGLNPLRWDARTWRNNLRLSSALVLLSFVVCHLLAHCFLIVSIEAADAIFTVTMYVWLSRVGTVLLLAAFFVHYGNALWSIYARHSLRLAPWQWTQVGSVFAFRF